MREVPIEFVERVRGDSKMSGAVAVESLRRITRWGLSERGRSRYAARLAEAAHERRRGAGGPGWSWSPLFIGVPLVEIFVLIQVGQVIGPWWTILLLILDSISAPG